MTTDLSDAAGDSAASPLSRRINWNNQVRRHALMTPERPALRFLGRTTTWRELDEHVVRLAAALHRRGIGFSDRVLVLMTNRPEYVETLLAVNLIGAIAVPVNTRLSADELTFIARDSEAVAIFTDGDLINVAREVSNACTIQTLVVAGSVATNREMHYEDLLTEPPSGEPSVDVPEDTTALLLYTSGTTGKPKGAMLSHSNLQAQCLNLLYALRVGTRDVASIAVPLFHIGGIISLVPQLFVGSATVIHPLGNFDAEELLDDLEAEGTTWIFLVPAQWQNVASVHLGRPRDLRLRSALWGAAPASEAVLRAIGKAFPTADCVAVFGQTEMAGIACVLEGADALNKMGSVGMPLPGVHARVVDENFRDVSPGEVGEILYRGGSVMTGYWGRPDVTAEAFTGGWFHSGDLVRRDEQGFVYIVDRKQDMIISGGENIYCVEIENALAGHPAIAEASVVGRADGTWGEVPVAVVVLRDGASVSLAELNRSLSRRLARFKLPKDLVVVDQLPRNSTGKILKPVLRQRFGSKDEGLS